VDYILSHRKESTLRYLATEAYLLQVMPSVVNVRRINSRKTGQPQPMRSLILTFAMPKLPKDVKAAFYRLLVRTYIPSALRCYKCQLYLHTSTSCNVTSAVCAICGTSNHGADPCTSLKPQCVNCKGEHTA